MVGADGRVDPGLDRPAGRLRRQLHQRGGLALARQESVVFPGSHCPKCGHAIRWHDNLLVLGWLLLRGHFRDCDAAISWRYPAVEALSAGLWISALLVWPGAGGGAA